MRSRTSQVAPQTLLPLKPVETLVLTMLATGERHGYGIRQDVLEHTHGEIEIEAGTLYRHIRHMESEGLLAPSTERRRGDDDDRRIYYKLTPFGRRVLTAELLRLRELIRLAESRRIIAPVRP
jgi:DNA-binding PadR family transcriptional regulator